METKAPGLGLERFVGKAPGATYDNRYPFCTWRCDRFTVYAYKADEDAIELRISSHRFTPIASQQCEEITRKDMENIKEECGYGDRMAVEIYPKTENNPAHRNSRYLWILPNPLFFCAGM